MEVGNINPELLEDIGRRGFAVVAAPDVLELSVPIRLLPALNALRSSSGLTYSLLTFSPENNRELSRAVTAIFRTALQSKLPGYRFLFGSMLVKQGGTAHELELHQDWSYVDESAHLPITCWMPLTDTDPDSGGVFVLAGSQHNGNMFRSNSYPTGRLPSALFKDSGRIQYLNVPRGRILLFHPALWHGSSPNPSSNHRAVLTCVAVPEEAELWYCHRKTDTSAQILRMDEHAYEDHLTDLVMDVIPDSFVQLKEIKYSHTEVLPEGELSVSQGTSATSLRLRGR